MLGRAYHDGQNGVGEHTPACLCFIGGAREVTAGTGAPGAIGIATPARRGILTNARMGHTSTGRRTKAVNGQIHSDLFYSHY